MKSIYYILYNCNITNISDFGNILNAAQYIPMQSLPQCAGSNYAVLPQ